MRRLTKQKQEKSLTLIGELHPSILFSDTLRYDISSRAEVIKLFDDTEINFPQLLASRDFWDKMKKAFISGYKLKGEISPEHFEKSLNSNFERIRRIYEMEFDEIASGDYKLLFLELGTAQEVFARNRDLKVISLDSDEFYHSKIEDKGKGLDYTRESRWIEAMQNCQGLSALLIAGAKHVQDSWGLITRLRNLGINPKIKYTP